MIDSSTEARPNAAAGKQVGKPTQGASYYEPSLTYRLLPGCRSCGTPHPLSSRPPVHSETCPKCGRPVDSPSAPVTVPAALTGGGVRMAAGCLLLRMGKALVLLWRRL